MKDFMQERTKRSNSGKKQVIYPRTSIQKVFFLQSINFIPP